MCNRHPFPAETNQKTRAFAVGFLLTAAGTALGVVAHFWRR